MNILVVLLYDSYLAYYESTLEILASRGHRIHLALMEPDPYGSSLAPRFAQAHAGVTVGGAPVRTDIWAPLLTTARATRDYLRYLEPRYRHASQLRERAIVAPLGSILRLLSAGPLRSATVRRILTALLERVADATPVPPPIVHFIRNQAPDVMIVSPMVVIATDQVDYVRAARELGIPSCLPVASWDNLSNKGLIKEPPDLVTVWNEDQRKEAVTMHAIPGERVWITGAPTFDKWFTARPRLSRSEHFAQLGLPSDRACLLYLGSSPFTTPHEVSFVRRWITELRSAPSASVRGATVIVRPHPQHSAQWNGVTLDDDLVRIWPRDHRLSNDAETFSTYVDSIVHSAAVIGINTSGQIEAAIVGRPVLTILAPEFEGTQQGTLHFHYLADAANGLVQVARGFPEHLQQLQEAIERPESGAPRREEFVRRFVRPNRTEQLNSAILATCIEELATRGALKHTPRHSRLPVLRTLLTPLALVLSAIWRLRSNPARPA